MTESVHPLRRSRSEYLHQAAATELGRDYKRQMITMMDLRPGQRILDIGCGPATDLADMAAEVGNGEIIGVDADPAMVIEARRNHLGSPPADRSLPGSVHLLHGRHSPTRLNPARRSPPRPSRRRHEATRTWYARAPIPACRGLRRPEGVGPAPTR